MTTFASASQGQTFSLAENTEPAPARRGWIELGSEPPDNRGHSATRSGDDDLHQKIEPQSQQQLLRLEVWKARATKATSTAFYPLALALKSKLSCDCGARPATHGGGHLGVTPWSRSGSAALQQPPNRVVYVSLFAVTAMSEMLRLWVRVEAQPFDCVYYLRGARLRK